jgi:general secretion pathway protein G
MNKHRRRRAGMTLIEILVVLVIMGSIASAVAFSVLKSLNQSRIQNTKTRARTIQAAVVAYKLEHGADCPDVAALQKTDILDSTTDHNDAWSRAFTIECTASTIHVWSAGPDGATGTEDDIGF